MADTLVDHVVLNIIPKMDKGEASSMQNTINNQMKQIGLNSGETFSKGFFGKIKAGFGTMRKNWLPLLGASAGLVAGFKSQDTKVMSNLQEQIAYADSLGTTASQIGMNTQDFAKLFSLIRSGDVGSDVAIKSMQEFAKRLGEYKATGAKSEVFGAIKDPENVGKAFLEAVALVGQEKDSGKKAYLIDQLLGGQGVEQMAEFFTKDISELMKQSSKQDYKSLANAIDTLGKQDDLLKQNRLRLEQENLIGTATKIGGSGADLINKREEFDLTQLMRETNQEIVKQTGKASEFFSVMGEAGVQSVSSLMHGFGETVKSMAGFSNAVDEHTTAIADNTQKIKNVTPSDPALTSHTYPAH